MSSVPIHLKYHGHHTTACRLLSGQARNLSYLPDFDGPDPCPWNSSGDGDGFIEIISRDEKVTGSLFVRLHEGTAGHKPFAVAHLNSGCRRCRMQRRGTEVLPVGMEQVCQLHGLSQHLLPDCVAELAERSFVVMNQQQIFHEHDLLWHTIVVE